MNNNNPNKQRTIRKKYSPQFKDQAVLGEFLKCSNTQSNSTKQAAISLNKIRW
jgi:hypothetical protein